jgi:hypothetical protein
MIKIVKNCHNAVTKKISLSNFHIYSLMRKRSRENDGELSEEFFPLSKRINSLQISGEFTFAQLPINPVSHHQQTDNNHNHLLHHHHQHQQQQSSEPATQSYNPQLSLEENPHYYTPNKNLYELYVQRQLRNGKQPFV